MYQQPWQLVPNRVRTLGGREIARFRGEANPRHTPDGAESWVGSVTRAVGATDAHPYLGCSQVRLPDGSLAWLKDVIAQAPEKVLGPRHLSAFGQELGILVKLLNPLRRFKLQCHPSRPVAEKLWNSSYGKTECWYVLSIEKNAPQPPYVMLGFKPGITPEIFEAAYRQGPIERVEALCHTFPVQPGDVYFVPAGMPHCLGEGCCVAEVQEPSDLTAIPMPQDQLLAFRRQCNPLGVFEPIDNALFDAQMLGSFDYTGRTSKEVLALTCPKPQLLAQGDWGQERLLVGPDQTPYFRLSEMRVNGQAPLTPTGAVRIGLVIAGEGQLKTPKSSLPIRQGSEVFLPYAAEQVTLEGDCTLLWCDPPQA